MAGAGSIERRDRGAGPPLRVTPVDAVALLVELGALILLGSLGWRLGSSLVTSVVLSALLVVGAGVLWGMFASPKARYPSLAAGLATKALVLGGSVVAAFVLFPMHLAAAYGAVVVIDTALLYVGPFARPRPERE